MTERVLAYRARLLAAVARTLASYGDIQRVVSLASVDVTSQARCLGGDIAAGYRPVIAERGLQ